MPRARQFVEEEVVERAMNLFWKKGYHDTSIDDLVTELGINRASLYNTFGGKKRLFDRTLDSYCDQNYFGMSQFLSTQHNVRVGIRAVFEKIINDDYCDSERKGCFIVNTSTEMLPMDISIRERLEAHKQRVELRFYDFLQRGVEDGQIDASKNLKMISSLLYTFMSGLRVNGKVGTNPDESMATVDAVLSLVE